MWMKTRFAQWEVEGQVRERVDGALAESEHGRLAKTTRVGAEGRMPGRARAMLNASVTRLLDRVEHVLLALRGGPEGRQESNRHRLVER